MKDSTRAMLEAAAAYGKRNSGYGFSTAKLIRDALANEDIVGQTSVLVVFNHITDPSPSEVQEILDALVVFEPAISQPGCVVLKGDLQKINQIVAGFPNWKAGVETRAKML